MVQVRGFGDRDEEKFATPISVRFVLSTLHLAKLSLGGQLTSEQLRSCALACSSSADSTATPVSVFLVMLFCVTADRTREKLSGSRNVNGLDKDRKCWT